MNKPLGPYSPFVRAGDFIIVSGQGGMVDGAVVEGGVTAQTEQTMRNLSDRLADAGAQLSDVVKTLCFLTDMGTFTEFNVAYAAAFGDHRPARSTVEVSALPGRDERRGRSLGVQAGLTVMAFAGHAGRFWPLTRWRSLARG